MLLIDFTILDVLIFGSRVFFNLYLCFFRPLKQLISIKDRQQLKSIKLRAYLICIKSSIEDGGAGAV